MRHSSRLLGAALFLVIVVGLCGAQETGADSSEASGATGTAALFVNTSPIRAEVVIDGTPVGATPVLVRELRGGTHTVSIQKPGYVTVEEQVDLENASVGVFTRELEGNEFVATFSSAETVVNGDRFTLRAAHRDVSASRRWPVVDHRDRLPAGERV